MRNRAALGAVAVAGGALVLGSLGFIGVVDSALEFGVQSAITRDASAIAERIEGSGDAVLPDDGFDDDIVQLVGPAGVVDSTDGDTELPVPRPGRDVITLLDGEEYVVVSESLEIDGEQYQVVVGASLDEVSSATGTVALLLMIVVPVAIFFIWLTTRVVVGRALSPVERIRGEVAAIGADELSHRVAESGTGDEIERLAATMNDMLDRLERAQRAQRQFVSDASHELRSPLASIRQLAEVARAHPDTVTTPELIESVLAEGARLQDLVESLLLLARLDERAETLARHPVDLDDLALSEVVRVRAAGEVAVSGASIGAGRTTGDARMLARALRNLVDNAIRHASTAVSIGVEESGAVVRVMVDDDGAGVPERERSRVFERFVRLDEARSRDAGGSGLGLAIVAEIARAHGGSVSTSASPLGGARFVVELPRSAP